MTFKIGYSRRAASTPAFGLIAEGWNELVQDGYTPDLVGTSPVTSESEVLYAISFDGDYVGVLAWQHHQALDVYEVTLAYVEPSSRKRHVFTELFAALKARAKAAEIATIYTPVAPENAVAKCVLEKMGSRVVTAVFEHAVSP